MLNKIAYKNPVAVIGASGHGYVVADCIKSNNSLSFVGFFDDDITKKVLGTVIDCVKYSDYNFVFGIGDNATRSKIAAKTQVKWATIIHSSAVVSSSAEIGEGTVVMPGAIVNARAKIGKHCIINSGAVVEHDNVIEDFVHISVGAKLGGTVHVGKGSVIGIGSVIKNNIDICKNCVIGAGAVVVDNIKKEGTYVGVPAKIFR